MEDIEANRMKGTFKVVEIDIEDNRESKCVARTITYEDNDSLYNEINSIKNVDYSHMVKFIKTVNNMNKSKSTIIFEYCPSNNLNKT